MFLRNGWEHTENLYILTIHLGELTQNIINLLEVRK